MHPSTKSIPGPHGHFLLGSIPAIQEDRVKFLLDLQRDYGDVVRIRLGPARAVVIFHPDAIQHVLQDNHKNYSKETRTYASVSLVAGDGLIISNGDFWLRQRRMMQPAFHQHRIDALSEMICHEAQAIMGGWDKAIHEGEELNITYAMMRLALRVATQALFSTKVHDPDLRLAEDISFLMSDTAFRFEHPFYPPPWVPAPRNRQFNAAMKNLEAVVYGIINERRRNPGQSDDLLEMLLQAKDEETGKQMSDRQLRDEVATIFLAGHETTALCLSWTLYLLSQHPDVEAQLRQELDEVLNGRPPSLADLPRLVYSRMVIDESMRLYPPAWLTERKVLGEDEIGGYYIPAGTTLGITQYVTHRHPEFWDDPHTFKPERFNPQNAKKRHPFAFFPFGGGPRMCIGKGMALLELQLVLPMLLQRCRFELVSGREVKTEPELSLRIKGGLWMRPKEV